MENVVFDSWALMAYFDNEAAAGRVEEILKNNLVNQTNSAITVVNLGEIWYNYARIYSAAFADDLIEKVKNMDFHIIPVNWQLTRIAAGFKTAGGISYADCFAAALARKMKAPLVTGDPEFRRLEGEIDITWI